MSLNAGGMRSGRRDPDLLRTYLAENPIPQKLIETAQLWHNSYAHRTEYLLSRLVICDTCGHHYVGTSAKSGRAYYSSCQSYVKRGKRACSSRLLNKVKLETAVLEHVQEQILNEDTSGNTFSWFSTKWVDQKPSAEEKLSPWRSTTWTASFDVGRMLGTWAPVD